MASITGGGATFVLSAGTVGRVISIGSWSHSYDAIDNNALDTTGYDEFIVGDTKHHTPLTLQVVFDPNAPATFAGATVTGTLTFSDTSTLAGTGFITEAGFDGVANNERVEGSVTFQFDGGTGPAFA